MENASKALIMAGSVLIALMIIGALLLMFNNLTTYQNADIQSTREAQIIEFNNQFENYNRKDVRGSELYSLLNKVVDYNRRKSIEGNGNTDEGQYLAYEPMKIVMDLVNKNEFSADGGDTRLIKKTKYEQSNNKNEFEESIKDIIDELERTYGSDVLTKLSSSLSKIFISETSSDTQKAEAINNYNKISKKSIKNFSEIKEGSTIREDVYKYYEYITFKRTYFECTGIEYNKKTGRIVKLEFKATDKVQ